MFVLPAAIAAGDPTQGGRQVVGECRQALDGIGTLCEQFFVADGGRGRQSIPVDEHGLGGGSRLDVD